MTLTLIPGIEGITTLEPLSMIFLILVQVGGRYLKIELTPAQQKIINNVIIQSIILFAIILMATKNIVNSMVKVYHKQNYDEEVAVHEQFETLYQTIVK